MSFYISQVVISEDNASPLLLSLAPEKDYLILAQDAMEVEINPEELDVIVAQGKMLLGQFQEKKEPILQTPPDNEWHRLDIVEPPNGAKCLFGIEDEPCRSGAWENASTDGIKRSGFYNSQGLFVSPPSKTWWRLTETETQKPDHLRDATEMVNTGWQNMADGSPIMEPAPPAPADVVMSEASRSSMEVRDYLDSIKVYGSTSDAPPAPAEGLVERVKLIIAKTVAGETFGEVEPESWDSEARAVIREIAAATDQMAPDRNLTWERVALWLEREAER